MSEKTRKRQERVVTAVRQLTADEWGEICSKPWTRATRTVIGGLYAGNGDADANAACEGAWSRVCQTNRIFIKLGLPYRIRDYELPDADSRYNGYWISRRGLRLHTVTEVL